MYTSVRQYRSAADHVAELAHRIDEQFADRLAEQPGFVAYEVIDCGEGRVVTVTVCQEREQADRSAELAGEFVRDSLQDITIERLSADSGEVLVNRARSEVMELVHA
jgi:hypothetical protein